MKKNYLIAMLVAGTLGSIFLLSSFAGRGIYGGRGMSFTGRGIYGERGMSFTGRGMYGERGIYFAERGVYGGRGMQEPFKVTRSISGKELENAFWKAGSEEIPLYIYMLKRTPDNAKEDIDLMLLSTSPDKRPIPFGRALREAEYRQQCGWYVNYLKTRGIQMNDAVLVYHLMLKKNRVKDYETLEVGVYPLRPQGNYLQWMGGSGREKVITERGGNPGYISLDSVGKCPPECIGFYIPFSATMKSELKRGFAARPQ
jgi:hypothetical protein